ncbi:Kunitz protease inhibitor [Trichuris trichiura]|uniref:Kunitz protease inhibitor n=1 Tax=Trichuris trichiura TaxID=36087 RepID=A0A077YUJ5_TRITR|nr:Kunitz protease inhibitor [Trichuris trichiura]
MNGPMLLLLLLALSFVVADEEKPKSRIRRQVMHPFLMYPMTPPVYDPPPPYIVPLVHPIPPHHMCMPKRDCTAAPDIQECGQSIARWFWNPVTSKCELFIYGGCSTNSNNFATEQECLRHCAGQCNRCQLPMDIGPCRASMRRWYYDSSSSQCKPFIYGGCGGNSNNFMSNEDCLRACNPTVCTLTAEAGPCNAYIPRWAYNFLLGRCYMFVYGGCGGNANNFETQSECEKVCNSTRPFIL